MAGAAPFVAEAAADQVLTWAPRFMFGSTPRLAKRQQPQPRECRPGESPCRAVKAGNYCCPNDNYCYINPAGEPSCCANGSRCDDPCSIESYRCTRSNTTTCCDRPCPAPSAFQCPESLGGNCCSVGSVCVQSNRCSPTIDPATVNTASASPTGCTVGQSSCAVSAGGGCCSTGWECAVSSSSLYCVGNSGSTTTSRPLGNAGGVPSPTIAPSGGDDGLSPGATAGLSVGVTMAGLTLISLIIWFIIARRRRHRKAADAAALSPGPGAGAGGAGGMSQVPSPGGGSSAPDYFGTEPTPGPFTRGEGADAFGMATFMSNRGAVPVKPEEPGDITAPVEIADQETTGPDTVEGRVELE